jgi:hypothetical protein
LHWPHFISRQKTFAGISQTLPAFAQRTKREIFFKQHFFVASAFVKPFAVQARAVILSGKLHDTTLPQLRLGMDAFRPARPE